MVFHQLALYLGIYAPLSRLVRPQVRKHELRSFLCIIDQYKEKIATLEREIPQLQEIAGKTWKKEDELKQLKSELAALDRKIQLELAPPTPESTEENRQGSEKKQTEQQPESPHADFVRSHLVIGRPGLTEPKGMKL